MPELPQILAAEPLVVEEQVIPAKTYDKYWLSTMSVQSYTVGGEATAYIGLTKYNYDSETNTYTVAPTNADVTFQVDNLITAALSGDTELATIMTLLMNYVIKKGRETGVVAEEE